MLLSNPAGNMKESIVFRRERRAGCLATQHAEKVNKQNGPIVITVITGGMITINFVINSAAYFFLLVYFSCIIKCAITLETFKLGEYVTVMCLCMCVCARVCVCVHKDSDFTRNFPDV